jgi:hypothetical protein
MGRERPRGHIRWFFRQLTCDCPGRDTDAYALFRARMAQPEYQALYKSRPSIAEFPNADCRNRNLRQFRVRGLVKVKAVAIWHALAFNLSRLIHLELLAT